MFSVIINIYAMTISLVTIKLNEVIGHVCVHCKLLTYYMLNNIIDFLLQRGQAIT